ncbi:protocatechuate 4,5-dioxygenase subunit alpha [Hydrogenophaga sp. T4]|nr:protocatechuate 4,5-dioxygenase subunit alpha [Hydrogenophaga sp. T4]
MSKTIPGTTPFDGDMAKKATPEQDVLLVQRQGQPRCLCGRSRGYMAQYGLNPQQADAIRSKQVLALLDAGGNATTSPSSPASSAWTCRTSARSRPA